MKRRLRDSQPDNRPPEELAQAILDHPYDRATFGQYLRDMADVAARSRDPEQMAHARDQSALVDALDAVAKKRPLEPFDKAALQGALRVIRHDEQVDIIGRSEFDSQAKGLLGILGEELAKLEEEEGKPRKKFSDEEKQARRNQAQDAAINLNQIKAIKHMIRSLAQKLNIDLDEPPKLGFLGL